MRHAKYKRSSQLGLHVTEDKAERRIYPQTAEGLLMHGLLSAIGINTTVVPSDRYASGKPVSEKTAERKASREHFTSIERHELQPIDPPGTHVEFDRPYGIESRFKLLNEIVIQELASTGDDSLDEPVFMFPTTAPTGRKMADKMTHTEVSVAPLGDTGERKKLPKTAYRKADEFGDNPLFRDFTSERQLNVPLHIQRLPIEVQIDYMMKAMGF